MACYQITMYLVPNYLVQVPLLYMYVLLIWSTLQELQVMKGWVGPEDKATNQMLWHKNVIIKSNKYGNKRLVGQGSTLQGEGGS